MYNKKGTVFGVSWYGSISIGHWASLVLNNLDLSPSCTLFSEWCILSNSKSYLFLQAKDHSSASESSTNGGGPGTLSFNRLSGNI